MVGGIEHKAWTGIPKLRIFVARRMYDLQIISDAPGDNEAVHPGLEIVDLVIRS